MPDTVPTATSPAPASEAKPSDAKQGASNLTEAQLARFLAAPPETPAEQTTTPEASAPEAPSTSAAETDATVPAEAESTETEAEAEAPKEDADDVLSQKSSLDQKTKERIQRRIDKEVGKRKHLEARIQELEGKLTAPQEPQQQAEEAPKIVPLPQGAPALANIESHEALSALQKQAKEAARWAEEMLDHEGVEHGLQVGDRVYTKSDLKTIVRQAKLTLEDHIPARADFLKERENARRVAHAEFGFLKDKTSPEYVMAQAIYKDMPWLRNVPQADWIVGLGVKGFQALQAEKQAASKAKDTPKPKVEPPKPPASQAAVSAGSTVRSPLATPKAVSVGEAFKTKGGISGTEFAAFLAKQELSRSS